MRTYTEAMEILDNRKENSAWKDGVKEYAFELLENIQEFYDNICTKDDLHVTLLNGVDDWQEYSWYGNSLIYNWDIAERLCNKTELNRTRDGELKPSKYEEWLDVQARALYQAANLLERIIFGN